MRKQTNKSVLLCPVEEAGCRIAADGLCDVCLAGGTWDRLGPVHGHCVSGWGKKLISHTHSHFEHTHTETDIDKD